MDEKVPVSYSDPERLIAYAPSSTHPSPRPSYPPSPNSSRLSASIRSYGWNPALFAVDRNGRLPPPRPILTHWRTKKWVVIGITILVFVAVAGIVAGITVGVLERRHTSLAASTPNEVSSSFNASNNMPPPTPLPVPPTQEKSPQPQFNSTIDDAIITGLQVAEAFNQHASWIWNAGGADVSAPSGSVVFSKTLPMGKANATTALVLLAADDHCQLYNNGKMVANKTSLWSRVNLLNVPLDPGPNMFAVNATNSHGGNPAGLRVSALITYADNSTDMMWSNETWRAFQPPPEGFAMQNIDDTDWEDAIVLGGSIWAGRLVMPTNFTTTDTTT
ncbi:hypothetical protein BD779DRAFT_222972 [Infundibulicybe gibba]|nr:hypothetical protein BD779DRAFT_222972 [Infundibulicybe gibba]